MTPEVTLRIDRSRQRADEWALVLAAEGLAPRVWRGTEGFVVSVDAADADRALSLLDLYERENPSSPLPDEEPEPTTDPAPLRVAIGVAIGLYVFFVVTGPRNSAVPWIELGNANAEAILLGETWRVVTALTLHADLGHVLSNAIIGILFLTAVCRELGPGLGCALVLLAGASGNFANALLHGSLHHSVGASTAVFGAVGLLGGLGIGRRRRRGARGRRALVSVAAALGLLAMLGTAGERVDVWAHLSGLAVGGLLGIPLGFAAHRRPALGFQWLLGAASIATLVASWGLALR